MGCPHPRQGSSWSPIRAEGCRNRHRLTWDSLESFRADVEELHGVSDVLTLYRYLKDTKTTFVELLVMHDTASSPLLLDVVLLMMMELGLS